MSKVAVANNRKKYIIGGSIFVVLLIAGGVSWYLLQNEKPTNTEHSHIDTVDEVSAATVEARQYIDEENVKGGVAYYDEKIKNTHDPIALQSLYIAKVDYLLQANDPAAAVEAAKKAVASNTDNAFAYGALARAYQANGQRAEALAEYKAAVAHLKGDEIAGRSNPRTIFEAKIKELES